MKCYKCGLCKTRDDFYKDGSRSSGLTSKCKECTNDPELLRKRRIRRKFKVMSHYGNKCNCCGVTNIEFLTIDHSNNDGNQHRREIGLTKIGGSRFYSWIIKNEYPDFLQILCWNCNSSKAFYGSCPHKGSSLI